MKQTPRLPDRDTVRAGGAIFVGAVILRFATPVCALVRNDRLARAAAQDRVVREADPYTPFTGKKP